MLAPAAAAVEAGIRGAIPRSLAGSLTCDRDPGRSVPAQRCRSRAAAVEDHDLAGTDGALEPLVYRPGRLETADETTWRPRPSSEILGLRVADIAMGSGAFLVAACRYLADRLVEAWRAEGREDALAARQPQQAHRIGADAEAEQVLLDACRQVAEHCMYGTDINLLNKTQLNQGTT